jgi:predicted ATP-binding protein involved in virulence
MFKFLKKEESIEEPVISQSEDWTKEIKRSQKIGQKLNNYHLFMIITRII